MGGSKKHFGKYQERIGTRAQVYHGTAYKTSGGLVKSDLIKNKAGRIVSKTKHNTAKREKRLLKHGYGTKKGTFGFVRLGTSKRGHSRSRKGGSLNSANMKLLDTMKHGGRKRRGRTYRGGLPPLSPSEISGIEKTSGADIQLMATNY
jgi:hypothetical protein